MNGFFEEFNKYKAEIAFKGIRVGSIAGSIAVLLILPIELHSANDSSVNFLLYRILLLIEIIAVAALTFISPDFLKKQYENIVFFVFISFSIILSQFSINDGGLGSQYYMSISQMLVLVAAFIPFSKIKFIASVLLTNAIYIILNLYSYDWIITEEGIKTITGGMAVFAVMAIFISITLYNLRYKEFNKRKQIEFNSTEIEQQREKLVIMNSQLEKANIGKDKFLSIIAHTLKNPLHGLMLSSENLIYYGDKMTNQETRKTYNNIRNISSIMIKQLENLLQWARVKYGRIEYDPTDFDLSELLTKNINESRFIANTKNISIEYIQDMKFPVYADIQMLDTVVKNLLNNAIKFTHYYGKIQVNASVIDNETIVSVSDSGIGLDDDVISQLFDIEIKNTMIGTNGETGSGLGLIVCKEFVDMHNGRIGAYNNDDSGSTFWFSVPN